MAFGKVDAGPAIGIDLGTTYSCVAVMRRGNVEIIPNGQGNRTTPSCVAFTNSNRLVGDAAINQSNLNPTNTIFGAKRLIGRKFSEPCVQSYIPFCPFKVIAGPEDRTKVSVELKGEEKQFYLEEISAVILANMREVAESYLGITVGRAVVTVPAYFNDAQRRTTLEAGRIAGLKIMRILNEPTAAAIAYKLLLVHHSGASLRSSSRNVLVFDLGGGTFDVSLLHIKGSRVEVKATAGDTHLGGEDFDNRMVGHFIKEFQRRHNGTIRVVDDIRSNPRALRRLRSACERAKRVLSFATNTAVEVECLQNGLDLQSSITRAMFEELNSDLFSRCIDIVGHCLLDAEMQKEHVHDVVLVGGSTRIPRIQRMLQEFFDGKELCKSINPDEAVAYGAAVQAAKLAEHGGKEAKELVLVDVAPLSMGIGMESGVMSVIIARNTQIPVIAALDYNTAYDNQTKVRFPIYEGQRCMARDNRLLGEFVLRGIPPEPADSSKIWVTFELDADGLLKATAELKRYGLKEQITVTYDSRRLNEEELDRVIRDAEEHKLEDRERQVKAASKCDLEVLLCNLKIRIRGSNEAGRLSAADKAWVEDEIDRVSNWLNKKQNAQAVEFDIKKEVLEKIWDVVCTRNVT